MYKYEKLIDDLIALMNTEIPDQDRAEQLVPAYHNACEAANERLYECEAMIRKGHRSEAIQLASQEPDLLDLVGLLAFPEREDYLEWLQVLGYHTMPPDLRVETGRELGRQLAQELSLADLLRKHRLLALGRGPLEARLTILRQIQARDADSPAWREDITALEKARMREISEDIDSVEMSGNAAEVEELLSELNGISWTVPVPDGYQSRLKTIKARQEARVLNAELEEIAEGISRAWSNLDVEAGNQYRLRWNKLIGLASLPDDSPVLQMANDALLWLAEEDQRLADEARRQQEQQEAEARRIREQEAAEAKRIREEKEAEAKRIQDAKEEEARRIREEKERQAAASRKRKGLFRWFLVLVVLTIVGGAVAFVMNAQQQRAEINRAVQKAGYLKGRSEYQQLVEWYDGYVKTQPSIADNLAVRQSVDDARATLAEFQRLLEKTRGDGTAADIDVEALERIEELVEEKSLSAQDRGLVEELRQQSDSFLEQERERLSVEFAVELETFQDRVALFQVGTDVTLVRIADTGRELTEMLQKYNALPDARRRADKTRKELQALEEKWTVKEEIEDLYQNTSSTLVGDNDAYTARLASFARKHPDGVIAADLLKVITDQKLVEGLVRWGTYYAQAPWDNLEKMTADQAQQLLEEGKEIHDEFGMSFLAARFMSHQQQLASILAREEKRPQDSLKRLCQAPVYQETEFLIRMKDGTRYYLPKPLTDAQLEEDSISFQAFGDLTGTLIEEDVEKEEILFYGKAPQREIIRRISEIVVSEDLQTNWDEAFQQMFKIVLLEKPPAVNQIAGGSEQPDITDPLWRVTVLYQIHRAASEGSAGIAQAFSDSGITTAVLRTFAGVDWSKPNGITAKNKRPEAKKLVEVVLEGQLDKVKTAMGKARRDFLQAEDCRVKWVGMLGKTPADQWKIYLSLEGQKIKETGTLFVTFAAGSGSEKVARVGTLNEGEAEVVTENLEDGYSFRIGRPVFFWVKQ